jgi:hypothetical protein
MNESFAARPTDECFGLKRYRRDEHRVILTPASGIPGSASIASCA